MQGCERREAVWGRSPEPTRTAADGELCRAWGSLCARLAERGAPMKPPDRDYHRLGRRIGIVFAAIRFSGGLPPAYPIMIRKEMERDRMKSPGLEWHRRTRR